MLVPFPSTVIILTTYRCNSRCSHCSIWQGNHTPPTGRRELSAAELVDGPFLTNASEIVLGGGEVTLSPLFWHLLATIPADKRIVIGTNALDSGRLVRFLNEDPHRHNKKVCVSIDGMERTHDRLRGVPGSFVRAVELLRQLQFLEITRTVSFTINRHNLNELESCHRLATEFGAGLDFRAVHLGGMFDNRESQPALTPDEDQISDLENILKRMVSAELERPDHDPATVVYQSWIADSLRDRQPSLPCETLRWSVVIDLYGQVFPGCFFRRDPIGNIQDGPFETIWERNRERSRLSGADEGGCRGCWFDCNIIPNIRAQHALMSERYEQIKIACLEDGDLWAGVDPERGGGVAALTGWYSVGRSHVR